MPFKRGVRETEYYPEIVFDFVLQVDPPIGGEVEFERIRELLYVIREQGINLKWVTLDTYQSFDFIQILKSRGVAAWQQSVDTSPVPYEVSKTAFMQRRVRIPQHDKAQEELVRLEYDAAKRKIDHPADGSKDCADAIAGVIFGLTMRRENYTIHKQPLLKIPESIRHAAKALGHDKGVYDGGISSL